MASGFLADEEDTTTVQPSTTTRSLPDKPPEGLWKKATSYVPPTTPVQATFPPFRQLPASSAAPLKAIPVYLLLIVLSCHWSVNL